MGRVRACEGVGTSGAFGALGSVWALGPVWGLVGKVRLEFVQIGFNGRHHQFCRNLLKKHLTRIGHSMYTVPIRTCMGQSKMQEVFICLSLKSM